jgi:hypothetical protein
MIKNTVVKHARKFGYITEVDITIAGVYNTAIFKIVGIADGLCISAVAWTSRTSHRIFGQIQDSRF